MFQVAKYNVFRKTLEQFSSVAEYLPQDECHLQQGGQSEESLGLVNGSIPESDDFNTTSDSKRVCLTLAHLNLVLSIASLGTYCISLFCFRVC